MEIIITLPGELPDLNSYLTELNRHRHMGAKMKKEATEFVAWHTKKYRTRDFNPPYHIAISWYCKNARKDPDNVIFAKKFIMDGLQLAGVIPQDTWKTISGFTDLLFIDKVKPRIEIIIKSTV